MNRSLSPHLDYKRQGFGEFERGFEFGKEEEKLKEHCFEFVRVKFC